MKSFAEFHTRTKAEPAFAEESARRQQIQPALLVSVLFLFVFVELDRATVYVQMWPAIILAAFIAAKVNHHEETLSYSLLFAPFLILGGYLSAARLLRRVTKIDWR